MDEQRSFLILTTDAGSGHRSAAEALEAALTDQYGDAARITICNPLAHEDASNGLVGYEDFYVNWMQRLPLFYHVLYALSELPPATRLIQRNMVSNLTASFQRILAENPADVIISVYPYFTSILHAINPPNGMKLPPLMSVVTDLGEVHPLWFSPADACCTVPTELAYHKALRCGMSPEQVVITGIPIHPQFGHPRASQEELRIELGWQPDLPTLLLLGGGAGVGAIVDLAKAIDSAQLPLQLAVVAGKNEDLAEELEQVTWEIPTQVYEFVKLPDLVHASDIIATKAGGLTVSEALAAGKPLLIHGTPSGQEAGNVHYVGALDAGRWTPDAEALVAQLHRWIDNPQELRSVTDNARRLGRPDAACEVAQIAWDLAHPAAAAPFMPLERAV